LESYITSDDITDERRIPLCSDNAFRIFYCPADTPLPLDQQLLDPLPNPIQDRWNQLITNKNYILNIKYGQSIKQFNLLVTGTPSDPYTSNLPMSIQNTIVTPNTLVTLLAG